MLDIVLGPEMQKRKTQPSEKDYKVVYSQDGMGPQKGPFESAWQML